MYLRTIRTAAGICYESLDQQWDSFKFNRTYRILYTAYDQVIIVIDYPPAKTSARSVLDIVGKCLCFVILTAINLRRCTLVPNRLIVVVATRVDKRERNLIHVNIIYLYVTLAYGNITYILLEVHAMRL